MVEAVPFEERHFAAVCETMRDCGLEFEHSVFHRHFLENPICAQRERSSCLCGITLLDGQRVVGFQGLVAREVYRRQERLLSYEMGVLGITPAYRVYAPLLTHMMKRQADAFAFYGNTSSPQASRMYHAFGFKDGCASCAVIRYYVCDWRGFMRTAAATVDRLRGVPDWFIRTLGACLNLVWPLLFPLPRVQSATASRRLETIDPDLFGAFWSEYLQKNEGLVSSRHPEVLAWLFDKELRSGCNQLIGRFEQERLVGYIMLRQTRMPVAGSVRYFVADWIALGNDPALLADLLRDACVYVRSHRGTVLELIGYPERMQQAIAACMPLRRRAASNVFIFKVADSDPQAKDFLKDAAAGWFWGAYDADRCVMG